MLSPRLVSVIVPTHNRPHTLRAALNSIRKLEGPDLRFEIIIGDNGSLPQTRKIAREFDCLHTQTSAKGAAAARNVAMARATGEFVAFLDDDDIWLDKSVRAHIRKFDQSPELKAVFGQVVFADHNLQPHGHQWKAIPPGDDDIFLMMMNGYFPQLGSTLIRRDVLDGVGYMDEELIGDEDWDWQMRIVNQYPAAIIDEPGVLFRGKAPGTADDLHTLRVSFTRKVFLRHYLANPKRWKSPIGVLRSYFKCVQHYYLYFVESAERHLEDENRDGARRVLLQAFLTIPSRFVRQVLSDKNVRELVLSAMAVSSSRHAPTSE